MTVPGREDKKSNDLFFTCSLIDYIARKTKNTRACVVNALGKPLSVRKLTTTTAAYITKTPLISLSPTGRGGCFRAPAGQLARKNPLL